MIIYSNFLYLHFQVWFQNRRAKFRKKDNTKKGPGRPAHNAHPQTCSGEPLDPEEIKKREIERIERKRKKQEERLKKMEEKRKMLGDERVMSDGNLDTQIESVEPADNVTDKSSCESISAVKKPICAFSIDRLLEEPSNQNSRKKESNFDLVQSSKSINNIKFGMNALYSVTQPVGFVVEQRQDEIKSDADILETSASSDECNESLTSVQFIHSRSVPEEDMDNNDADDESEDIDVTDGVSININCQSEEISPVNLTSNRNIDFRV